MAVEQKWKSSHFLLPLKLSESSELPSTMSAVIGTPGLVDCSIRSICTSTCPKNKQTNQQTNKAKTRSLSASKRSQTSTHSSNALAIKNIYDCTTAHCSTTQSALALGRFHRLDDPSNLPSLFRPRRPAWQFLHPTVLNKWGSSSSLMRSGTKYSTNEIFWNPECVFYLVIVAAFQNPENH